MANIDALRKKLIQKAKKQVSEKYTGRDSHIVRAVNVLEDLDDVFNLLFEQLREWYGMHFPELENLLNDNEKYVKIVLEIGNRKNFEKNKISELIKNEELSEKVEKAAKNSMGSEINERDLKEIKKLAENALAIRKERQELENYVSDETKKLCPKFAELAGATIAAKMISKASSLERLAKMPSSTVQLLGAEKALFAHLKGEAKSPKYGILFQHAKVKAAKKEEKGKIARKLAGKLAIAVKQDYFGKQERLNETN